MSFSCTAHGSERVKNAHFWVFMMKYSKSKMTQLHLFYFLVTRETRRKNLQWCFHEIRRKKSHIVYRGNLTPLHSLLPVIVQKMYIFEFSHIPPHPRSLAPCTRKRFQFPFSADELLSKHLLFSLLEPGGTASL